MPIGRAYPSVNITARRLCFSSTPDMLFAHPRSAMNSATASEVRKTQLLTLVVIASNVVGNVSLSHGMRQVGKIVSASPLDYARAFANPWTVAGVLVLALWMITDLRSEEHTSELQSLTNLVCRLLLDTATTEIYTLSLHDALPI